MKTQKITCKLMEDKLNTLFNRVLEDNPENDESILLDKILVNKKDIFETSEIVFLYEKTKCSIQYEENTDTGSIDFLFHSFKNLNGVKIDDPEELRQLDSL